MLLEFLWNIMFSINWHRFFGMTKGVAWGNLITVLSLFPLPFETLHMKSTISFFHYFYVYASCWPLHKSCDNEPVTSIFEERCLRRSKDVMGSWKLPRLLGSILGSFTEITAGEQPWPCTSGSVSSDPTQREGGEENVTSFPFSFTQSAAGREGSCSAEIQPFPPQQDTELELSLAHHMAEHGKWKVEWSCWQVWELVFTLPALAYWIYCSFCLLCNRNHLFFSHIYGSKKWHKEIIFFLKAFSLNPCNIVELKSFASGRCCLLAVVTLLTIILVRTSSFS